MIKSIISFSVKNKLIIGLFTAALIIAGIWSMTKIPVDAVPDITNNQVQVITVAPNLGTQEVEQFITYPVELAMANLPEVEEIRSVSRFGLSLVTIVFKDDVGTYLPRQLVSEKLSAVKEELPPGVNDIEIGPISTGLGEVYQYTLHVDSAYVDQYNEIELRSIQDWIVKRQFAMVPGVVEINSFGGSIKQYEVKIKPHQLRSFGLTILDVFEALESNNENSGGAYIVKDHFANYIRGEGLIKNIQDIENTAITIQENIPIYVKNVADVEIGKAVRYGAVTKNGKGEAIGGTIMMVKNGNSNKTIKAIKERVKQIEKSLPPGVSINAFLDRSELISNTTKTVSFNLLEGGLIVIFVLVILLGNWRGGIIVASTIPLSLLFAFILMHAFGVWANLMSLGAIDFGIIVDGAVIIVESTVFLIYQRIKTSQLNSQKDKNELTIEASNKMMNSAFFGQLIILIVFVPILFLEGIEGKMFKPMALTFMFAMAGAMLLCLTYVPMMSSWFLNTKKTRVSKFGDQFIAKAENIYQSLLAPAIKKPLRFIVSSIALLTIALYSFSRLGGEFIPQLDEGSIAFHILMKPGTSLEEGIKTSTKVEKVLIAQFPEVKQVVSRFGVSNIPTDPMPMDVADSFIILKPQDEWTSAKDKEELIEKMHTAIRVFPGVSYEFSQPIEMRFNELITGVREDVAIKIYGDDLNTLAKKAKEIEGLVKGIAGVGDVKAEATSGLPQITIRYQREKLGQYGLHIADANTLVQSAFAGSKAGVVYEGERKVDLIIRLHENNRTNIQDVRNLFVTLPNGMQIPIKEIAVIDYEPGPMQISRDNTNRRTYVGINVRGRDVQSLIEEIQDKIESEIDLPSGYYIQYGGAFENLQRATAKLKIVVPMALVLIFILIFLALKSIKQTAMIYVAIPFAAVGGVFSLWLRGLPFSISAGVGFVVLFGVAVLNGLVLISGLNELKEDSSLSLLERLKQGTKRRVRPILLTALTDILGFLPMALSTTAGAEVQRPLATVVIGGLITSTILTLFILPIIYYWMENKQSFAMKSATAILVGFLAISSGTYAQNTTQTITVLDEAMNIGLKQNGFVKMAKSDVELSKQEKRSSFDPNKLELYGEYGQMNSLENDVYISVNQSFEFPSVYSRQAKLGSLKIKGSESLLHVTENELKRDIRKSWYRLAYLNEKLQLITYEDSLFKRMLEAQTIRFQTEETGMLEYTSAQTLVLEIENEITLLKADIAIEEMQLRILLADTSQLQFEPKELGIYSIPLNADTLNAYNNPYLQYIQNKIEIAESEQKVEKAKALPDLSIGYFAQSLKGFEMPNTNIAGSELGFRGFQAGITVPLFFGSYSANAKAAKIKYEIAETEAAYYQIQVEGELNKQVKEWEKYLSSLNFYHENALPQAERIIKTADLAYENGAITYYEYFLNIAQAIQLKYKYLEYLDGHNQTLIALAHLLGE